MADPAGPTLPNASAVDGHASSKLHGGAVGATTLHHADPVRFPPGVPPVFCQGPPPPSPSLRAHNQQTKLAGPDVATGIQTDTRAHSHTRSPLIERGTDARCV